ncbi:MAG: cell division protein FtsQ/DivIB [Kiritimatiellia bacterium]
MKANRREPRIRPGLLTTGVFLVAFLAVGVVVSADKLKEIYLEQCVIRDMASQVSITSGKMVKADVIAENLGLRPGANLATIDFAARREELLAKVPNLLSIRITRKLPDQVAVVAEERVPVARLERAGRKRGDPSGRVVDTEGMVFLWQRGTQSLPVIRETQLPGTAKGCRIRGRLLAALRLVEACREPELLELGLLEVDTSKHDFLVATLGNYSKAKILWEEMDESTPRARNDLVFRLTLLRDTIRTRIAPNAVIWNATIPNRIFADTQETL